MSGTTLPATMTTDGAYLVLIAKLNQVNAEAQELNSTTIWTRDCTYRNQVPARRINIPQHNKKCTPAPHSKVLVHKWPSICLRIFRLIGQKLCWADSAPTKLRCGCCRLVAGRDRHLAREARDSDENQWLNLRRGRLAVSEWAR